MSSRIRLSVFLGLLLISAVDPAQSSDCLDYSDYPHWISHLETPVWATDVILDGDLAYLAIRTAGIIIVDVSDPWHPVQIGSLGPADDPAWHPTAGRLALSGIHLFVTDTTGRLVHVLDVSDPTAPVFVTQVPTGVFPDGLALAGNSLYVAVQETGVEIFDITNPATPQLAGTLPVYFAHNLFVSGNSLYVTGYTNSLSIYDLTEPMAPVLFSQVVLPAEIETYDVAVRDDLAYVSGATGTWIVDVQDPGAATLVGSLARWARSITIDGRWAFLTPNGLEIFDLIDPLAPVLVNYLPPPKGDVYSQVRQARVAGGMVFTAAHHAGLLIADMTKPASPPLTTTLAFPATVERIHLWGDFVLAADQTEGLLVIDLADPANPELTASLASYDARAVITEGHLAYLADGGDGLKVIDLSTPSAPLQIGHYDTYSRVATGLALDNHLVYLAADLNGLMIFDVATPTNPELLGRVDTESRPQDVCLSGNMAYVADRWGGLQVVDVTDPNAPFVAGSLSITGQQEAVVLDGSTLFIGGIGTGVRAIDITTPSAPEVLGWLPFDARDLALDGNILVAAGGDGLTLIDRTVPTALKTVGFIPTGELCPAVAISDSYMLAAGNHLHSAWKQCPSASGTDDGPPELAAWARLSGHPNPFNPRIDVAFELKTSQQVSLEVYDVAGRRVTVLAAGEFSGATHRVSWDGNDSLGQASPAGCYFLLLRGEQNTHSLKIMLVR